MNFERKSHVAIMSGEHCTTIDVARELGMAVRSVQMMVDRGELEAWKTPGGHRRISRASIDRWLANRKLGHRSRRRGGTGQLRTVLLIEDSAHFQNLVSLVIKQHFPGVTLHTAVDGIVGLALFGQMQPDVLLFDLQLPGIDGSALLTSLRAHPELSASELVVMTSLSEEQRKSYAFALHNVPVVNKARLVEELTRVLGKIVTPPEEELTEQEDPSKAT